MRHTILALMIIASTLSLCAKPLKITKDQSNQIAKKIWKNEGNQQRRNLVAWNRGEEFASMGIGHFIWYTKSEPMWFKESFPPLLKFMVARGVTLPKWLSPKSDCVWNSYAQWQYAKKHNTPKMKALTNFMYRTKGLQAQYMVDRLNRRFPEILAYAKPRGQATIVQHNYNRLLYKSNGTLDPQGAYILIDYINFKGDGITQSERYQGKGWGLYQVLAYMDTKTTNPYCAFAKSGKFILDRLTKIAPSKRNLKRFRTGWFKRMDTYCQ